MSWAKAIYELLNKEVAAAPTGSKGAKDGAKDG
jgi:hypothetical protein